MTLRMLLATVVTTLLLAGPAGAAPARTLTVEAGRSADWAGTAAVGLNWYYFGPSDPVGELYAKPGTCSTDPRTYCDTTLVRLVNPVAAGAGEATRTATVTLGGYGPGTTDFDLLVFESDADGGQGRELARDGDRVDPGRETVSFPVTTTPDEPDRWVLVQVVYFLSAYRGYDGTIAF